jgi:MerR family mercuric resistance operon transcriptional regulator
MADYTIGQIAKSIDVPISTIRFYERTGLFKPDARTGSNYRLYSEKALDRLRFIRSAQATGFSLDDIRDLLSLVHADEAPCAEIADLTKKRLAEIRKRLKELRHVERVLSESLANCCKGTQPDLCDRIAGLKGVVKECCAPGTKCESCS